jgi:hypothetical protein
MQLCGQQANVVVSAQGGVKVVRSIKCYDAAAFCLAQFFVSTDQSNGKRSGRKHLLHVVFIDDQLENVTLQGTVVTFPCVLGSVVHHSLCRSPCALEMEKRYVSGSR